MTKVEEMKNRLRELKLYNILLGRFDDKLTIDEMNKWISFLVSQDKSMGIILSDEDFKGYGDIVYQYMLLYFGSGCNFDSDGVASFIMLSTVGNSLITENPILDAIKSAINSVQIKKGLLEMIGFRTVDDIDREISNCNAILSREAIDVLSREESITVQICDSIINPVLPADAKDSVRQRLYNGSDSLLYNVCLLIVRLGIYYKVYDSRGLNINSKYDEYRKNAKAPNNKLYLDAIRVAYNKIITENVANSILNNEETKIAVLNAKREYRQLVHSYISNFYQEYHIEQFLSDKGLEFLFGELFSEDTHEEPKLFGEFDVLCMPPEINAYSKYSRDGIIIPSVNKDDDNDNEFVSLCVLALKYLMSNQAKTIVR